MGTLRVRGHDPEISQKSLYYQPKQCTIMNIYIWEIHQNKTIKTLHV